MIIVEKQALKFLLAGRKITVTSRREHKKGRTYAVGVRHNRTVCRARILKASETKGRHLLQADGRPRWRALGALSAFT